MFSFILLESLKFCPKKSKMFLYREHKFNHLSVLLHPSVYRNSSFHAYANLVIAKNISTKYGNKDIWSFNSCFVRTWLMKANLNMFYPVPWLGFTIIQIIIVKKVQNREIIIFPFAQNLSNYSTSLVGCVLCAFVWCPSLCTKC